MLASSNNSASPVPESVRQSDADWEKEWSEKSDFDKDLSDAVVEEYEGSMSRSDAPGRIAEHTGGV